MDSLNSTVYSILNVIGHDCTCNSFFILIRTSLQILYSCLNHTAELTGSRLSSLNTCQVSLYATKMPAYYYYLKNTKHEGLI